MIGLAEEYEQLTGNNTPDFDEFRAWMQSGKKPDVLIDTDRVGPEGYGDGHMPGMASQLLANLYGYAKLYVKKSLEGTQLQTIDEFRYLVTLLVNQPFTKTKLIQHNINEKPTGMEIIKRLIKLGYIEEREHETDKRSKNLFVTEAGRNVLSGLYVKVTKISQLILGDLSIPEQRHLYSVLQRLDDFHKPIFLDNLHKVDELLDDDK